MWSSASISRKTISLIAVGLTPALLKISSSCVIQPIYTIYPANLVLFYLTERMYHKFYGWQRYNKRYNQTHNRVYYGYARKGDY